MHDVDGKESSELADQYGVTSIPTLIFIGKDGSVANKIIGMTQKELIVSNIENIIK